MTEGRRSAQAWSMDFMASVSIFLMVLIVLFFVWEYTAFQSADQMVFNEMENKALLTVDTLIRTQGFPEDWNDSNVQVLGLASEENVLNETKLLTFISMGYDDLRRAMGIPSQEFFFQLQELNGSQAWSGGTELVKGLDPVAYTNSTAVVPVERYILFDHKVARLRFMLWT